MILQTYYRVHKIKFWCFIASCVPLEMQKSGCLPVGTHTFVMFNALINILYVNYHGYGYCLQDFIFGRFQVFSNDQLSTQDSITHCTLDLFFSIPFVAFMFSH